MHIITINFPIIVLPLLTPRSKQQLGTGEFPSDEVLFSVVLMSRPQNRDDINNYFLLKHNICY